MELLGRKEKSKDKSEKGKRKSKVASCRKEPEFRGTSRLIASAIAKSTTREHLPMLSQWRWTGWRRANPKECARKERKE